MTRLIQFKQTLLLVSILTLLLTNLATPAVAQVFTNACSEVVVTPSPAAAPDLIRQFLPTNPQADLNTRTVVVKFTGYLNGCENGGDPVGFTLQITYRTLEGKWRDSLTWGTVGQCDIDNGIRMCWGVVTVKSIPLTAILHKTRVAWLYNSDQEIPQ